MTDADLYTYAGLAIRTLLTVMILTWLIEMVAFRRLRPAARQPDRHAGLAGLGRHDGPVARLGPAL
jgi:hypothetical protein